MKKIILFAAIALSAYGSLASAACTRADLTGTWRLYTIFDSVARCTAIMPSTGTAMASSSSCYLPGVASSIPASGSISVDSTCHVTGQITVNYQQRTIDAWISKGKDSMSGIGWSPSNAYTGDTFSGVKQ